MCGLLSLAYRGTGSSIHDRLIFNFAQTLESAAKQPTIPLFAKVSSAEEVL